MNKVKVSQVFWLLFYTAVAVFLWGMIYGLVRKIVP